MFRGKDRKGPVPGPRITASLNATKANRQGLALVNRVGLGKHDRNLCPYVLLGCKLMLIGDRLPSLRPRSAVLSLALFSRLMITSSSE
jgi:hypothetical protein